MNEPLCPVIEILKHTESLGYLQQVKLVQQVLFFSKNNGLDWILYLMWFLRGTGDSR